ncbi:MAG: sulfatase-like hydrolase/transferase [Planctomycetota bacterium]
MYRSFPWLCLILPILSVSVAPCESPPNLVLIFVDDLGYGDLGCYGNPLNKTPNIDRMAAEGQRWTSFYASGSTCVPSRRGLMSGRHPGLLGREPLNKDRAALMPAMLSRQGYACAILGKWHLAGYPKDFTRSPMHPLECGFDYHFGTPGSNDVPAPRGRKQTRALFDECEKFTFPVPLIRGREVIEHPVNQELLTKRYTEEAVRWINDRRDERFFLYLAHNMPHAPIFASPEFQGRSDGGRFGDVVEEIDWSVGRVLGALKQNGLDEKTLVVFTSDNGPWTMFGPHGGVATPLRGEKGTPWEGGSRVPAIFRWPGKIQPRRVDDIAANLDLYATFAALAGGEQPNDKPGYVSVDLASALFADKPSPRTQWLFGNGAFRSGNHKILPTTKDRSSNPDTRSREPMDQHDPPLLFDLEADVSERHNLAEKHPEIIARLITERSQFGK